MTKLVDKMPITEHLNEFRKKLLVSLVAIFIGFIICFYYSEYLFYLLTLPLKKILKFSLSNPFIYFEDSNVPTINLVFLAPAEAFWMHMKIAAVSGIILVSPVILYELWGFVAPGLLPKEKRYIIPMMTVMTSLFLIGALFCFLLVLPFAMQFLLTYKTETIKPMLSVGAYIDFCLKFILAFGAVFELPVIIVFLTKMGIVTADTLAKNRKYAVIIAFVLAALLTPTPDAFNQTLMAVPIILLYEAGIWASRILVRKKSDTSIEKKDD